jgi:hypothetical protein
METITTSTELKNAIRQLEQKQAEEWTLLKQQCLHTYESLKPVNAIKNTLHELMSSSDLKKDLLGTLLGLAIGFLTKKVAIGSTDNPLKQLLGNILQMGVAGAVSKNEDIKSTFLSLLRNVFSKSS